MKKILALFVLFYPLSSCNENYFLEEVPMDSFSPDNLFVSEEGYNTAITALYASSRNEHAIGSNNYDYNNLGTDLAQFGRPESRFFNDYGLVNSYYSPMLEYWEWGYVDMIQKCNLLIEGLENSGELLQKSKKDQFLGEAYFFRAYTYMTLGNLFGSVPIVEDYISSPKFDFQRPDRKDLFDFIKKDLELAADLLPVFVDGHNSRIVKAAAIHLLSVVYLVLAKESDNPSYFNSAVEACSKIIKKEVGDYEIMTARFGDVSRQGDVFSDLFWTHQQSANSGNKEVIWCWQFESFVNGGRTTSGGGGNRTPRIWCPEQEKIVSPNGILNLPYPDTLLRGIGMTSPTNYWKYDIWEDDWDDMRNSKHNIRREFYYNNPSDLEYFGKPIRSAVNGQGKLVLMKNDGSLTNIALDTLRGYYPWIRKVDGKAFNDNIVNGISTNNFIKIRLAETYLLRAEAYLRIGDLAKAAADVNVIRDRVKARRVEPNEVTIDFILDERARELMIEEPRRQTLSRLGLLYERVRRYNPVSAQNIKPHHNWWPIPQNVIDSNTGAVISQNEGY